MCWGPFPAKIAKNHVFRQSLGGGAGQIFQSRPPPPTVRLWRFGGSPPPPRHPLNISAPTCFTAIDGNKANLQIGMPLFQIATIFGQLLTTFDDITIDDIIFTRSTSPFVTKLLRGVRMNICQKGPAKNGGFVEYGAKNLGYLIFGISNTGEHLYCKYLSITANLSVVVIEIWSKWSNLVVKNLFIVATSLQWPADVS